MLEMKEIIDVVKQVQSELCTTENKVNEIVDIHDSYKEQYYLGNILFCKNILGRLLEKLEDDEKTGLDIKEAINGMFDNLVKDDSNKFEENEEYTEMYDFQSGYIKAMMTRGFSFEQSVALFKATLDVSGNNEDD